MNLIAESPGSHTNAVPRHGVHSDIICFTSGVMEELCDLSLGKSMQSADANVTLHSYL